MTVADIGSTADSIVRFASETERLVEIGAGLHMRTLDWEGSAPTIVLVHGLGDSADIWQAVIARIPATFRVLAIDLPGHGGSSRFPPTDYQSATLTDAVETALLRCNIGPTVLVGHSLGGEICLELASRSGTALQGLVLVDYSPSLNSDALNVVYLSLESLLGSFGSCDEYARALGEMVVNASTEILASFATKLLEKQADGRYKSKTDPSVIRLLREKGEDATDRTVHLLETLRCPILVIRGAYSGVLSLETVSRLRTATEVQHVANSGHAIPLDNPLELADAIVAFVAGLNARTVVQLPT